MIEFGNFFLMKKEINNFWLPCCTRDAAEVGSVCRNCRLWCGHSGRTRPTQRSRTWSTRYRVFIKYCVFSLKFCDFSELCQFWCSAGVLPACCVYTLWQQGKTERGKSPEYSAIFGKNTIFFEHPSSRRTSTRRTPRVTCSCCRLDMAPLLVIMSSWCEYRMNG